MTRNIRKTKKRMAKRTRLSPKGRTLKRGLAKLVHRVADLVLAYVAIGRLTPGLRREVFGVKHEVDAWRARTGSDAIRATQLSPVRSSGRTSRKVVRRSRSRGWCNCEVIMVSRGRLCFLVECDASIGWCSYVCFGPLPTNSTVAKGNL